MKAAYVLAAAGLAVAQISDVPQCAIQCLLPAVTSTGCDVTDFACSCKAENQKKIRAQAEPCLKKNCSAEEQQKALDAANGLCPGGVSGSVEPTSGATSGSASSTEAPATSTQESSAQSTGASSTGASSTGASSTGASSTGAGVLPPVSTSAVSSGMTTAMPTNGTQTTTGPSSTEPAGVNGATGPVAGVLAAMAAAVVAL